MALLEDLLPLDLRNLNIHIVAKRQVGRIMLVITFVPKQAHKAANGMQVVISYLHGPEPDLESSHAAYEAYFAEPLQAMMSCATERIAPDDRGLQIFASEASNLRQMLSEAEDALEIGGAISLQHALRNHPLAFPAKALEDALAIIADSVGCCRESDTLQPESRRDMTGSHFHC